MGKYGFKINNYEAGSIYAIELGVRDYYDYNEAMLTNSLFLDYLSQHKLFTAKKEFTRDIIGVEFNYGTRSYTEELAHVQRMIKDLDNNTDLSPEELNKKKQVYNDIKAKVECNKKKYKKKSADEIREVFYQKGLYINYKNYKDEITRVHYKMLYRSPGKAKKGTCMFINAALYPDTRNFLYMGITLPKKNAPIIEIGAYSSLVTSTIIDHIQINPADILILEDVDSVFNTKVISIETNKRKECQAITKDNYELKNTLFDGQALIDSSIFPEDGDGYILLRQHFTKCAAFSTNIQQFFMDYYGDNYETARITDMFGEEHIVKNIKLITTDNAMKWLKFDISYQYWSEIVNQNGALWGIVKTAHESKLGTVQRMSYQMVNTLDEKSMESVLSLSNSYINKLKTDINTFIGYLKQNSNFSNDFDALIALYEQDHEFEFSTYFRDRRKNIIQTYLLNLKSGKVIQNAENLTIVGNPYAMLLHAVGEDVNKDPTFAQEDGVIQCFTNRFADGEYLAEFRNPFNSRNNLGYLHNVHHEYLNKYFNFGNLIIAVNMIHTDFQDRNNGSDQDSDSIYVTNQPDIVSHAKYCYAEYPTIVNNIPKDKNSYNNTLVNFAKIDNILASSQLAIGESSNLAQICLTYTYNFKDQKYIDYVCILSVLAQAAIDGAKRKFDVDIPEEIKRIKEDIHIKQNGYPMFWSVIRRDFNKTRLNQKLKCPMNYIYRMALPKYRSDEKTLPMNKFFCFHQNDIKKKSKAVESLIEKYSIKINQTQESEETITLDEYLLLRSDFDKLVEDIRRMILPNKYLSVFSWLLNRAFMITPQLTGQDKNLKSMLNKRRSTLLKVLFEVNQEAVLRCFSKNVPPFEKDNQKSPTS